MTRRGLRATHAPRLSHPRCPFGHRCTAAGQPQPAALRSRVPAQIDRREPHMHRERERDERASTRGYGPDHLITLLCSSAGSLSLSTPGRGRIHSARFWPAASLSSYGAGQAARHHPWRGARARGPDLCRCVRVWRARGAGASPARAGDKVPDEAASCGSVRIGPGPRAQPQVGGWTEKERRCLDSGCRGGVAWRGAIRLSDGIPYHAMHPRRGTSTRRVGVAILF